MVELVCFFLLRIFSVTISVSPHVCLSHVCFIFDFYVSKTMNLRNFSKFYRWHFDIVSKYIMSD